MTALSTKMSYPGTSSSYQSYYQPVHHNGYSNGHHLGSYPPHPRFSQQQHSMQRTEPAAYPHSNNMQTQGNQWGLYRMSLTERLESQEQHFQHQTPSSIEQSQQKNDLKGPPQPTIKSEPITHTEISPSQTDSTDLSQHVIANNSASNAIHSYSSARPHGTFAQPRGIVTSQFPRTWIPAHQQFIGNAPRAPVNSVLAQVPNTGPARQTFVGTVPRPPANSALTQPLQNNLVNNSEHLGRSWVVSNTDFQKYSALFHKADMDKDGYVTGMEVRDMFIGTGLSQKYLIHIWDLVDTNQKGCLNCEQFALAMWMAMRTAVHKIEPPNKLTPEMIPPSMRIKAPSVSNMMQYRKKENLPKPTNNISVNVTKKVNKVAPATVKPKKVTQKGTAKKSKHPSPPKNDLYGCPKCCLMYDDSQHSPRQLPCSHTLCIDCIDEALNEDVVNCFVCGSSHTVLAAADFPVNVFITELLRRFLEEQSEEDRKKYMHDADSCFYCEYNEPPLKRIKVGDKKIICEIESSQENIPNVGCEMDKMERKSDNTDITNEIKDTFNGSENNLNSLSVIENNSQDKEPDIVSTGHQTKSIDASVSNEQSLNHNSGNMEENSKERVNSNEKDKMDVKSGNTNNTNKIYTCNELESNVNSLSVLENDSQGMENSILSTELQTSSIDASVSSEQNLKHNTSNIEENNGKINSHENTIDDKLPAVENVTSKYSVCSETLNELGKKHIDRMSCKEMVVENTTKVNSNVDNTLKTKAYLEPAYSNLQTKCNSSSIQEREKVTEYQRITPRIDNSKIDENMNSLSVEKFLQEIL